MTSKLSLAGGRFDKMNIVASKRMLQGAGFAFALLTSIFLTMGALNTSDLRWIILPYIFVPVAGVLSGYFFHLFQPMRDRGGIYRAVSNILNLVIFLILFSTAFILGMNGPD